MVVIGTVVLIAWRDCAADLRALRRYPIYR